MKPGARRKKAVVPQYKVPAFTDDQYLVSYGDYSVTEVFRKPLKAKPSPRKER